MPNIKYKDARRASAIGNPVVQFRPSGKTRILKGTLEYSLFQSALTYGFAFGGFGMHSYFFQVINKSQAALPWTRTRALGKSFAKYGVLSLAFYYAKEVYFGAIDGFIKDKPSFQKLLNYSFVFNLLAGVSVFPLMYLVERRNVVKAVRGCLAICLFSMLNDVVIELRRKSLISQNYSRQELQEMFVKNKIHDVRQQINEDLKDSKLPFKKRQELQNLNLDALEKHMIVETKPETNDSIELERRDQLAKLGEAINYQLQWLKGIKGWFFKQ